METNHSNPDPREAAAALDAVADAQRVVRDQPWPLWLYPANALLLGALVLAGLAHDSRLSSIATLVCAVTLALLNYWAGRLIGTPFAIPTSRGFLALVILAGVFMLASVFARGTGATWFIVFCAAGAVVSYGLGSVLHYRSTRK